MHRKITIYINMYKQFWYITIVVMLATLVACKPKSTDSPAAKESKEAKALLQGVWLDQETENVVFEVQGDTVFYPDSTSQPAYFKIVADTMVVGASAAKYPLVKQTQHIFWFLNQAGDTIKLVKSSEESDTLSINHKQPEVLTMADVTKRDTVVSYDGKRYHCYVAINPTRHKVNFTAYNDDGVEVSNVYYDNIVHVSVFSGNTRLFGKNFQKQEYVRFVPENFLDQALLGDMKYDHTDAEGFHFNATLCTPNAASCYLVETLITFQGKLSMKLIEY